MELVYYPDPILKKRAAPLLEIDQGVKDRAAEMFAIMYRERGVGLAAPQVGWSTRLFVTNTGGPEDTSGERVYINPRVLHIEGTVTDEEGCLSIPEVRGPVERHDLVRIEARGLDGEAFQEELSGLPARIFQHELDHLDGILFIVRLKKSDRLLVKKTLKNLEREYRKRMSSSR